MNRSLTWNAEHWQEDFFSLFFFGRWYKNRRSSDSGSHDLVLQTRREKLNYHLRSKVLLAKTYIKSLPTLPPPHRVVPQENKKTRRQEREFISSQLNRAAAVSTGKKTMRGFKGWFHLHSQRHPPPCSPLWASSCLENTLENHNTLQATFLSRIFSKNVSPFY